MSKSDALVAELRAKRLAKTPAKSTPPAPAPRDPTRLVLGREESGAPLSISAQARLEHAHVIGTTGSGKSKFLEHCILQDIALGHGVCVVDPHGNHPDSLYRAVLSWVGTRKPNRPVHVIDPNAGTHATGFNPLQLPDAETALSVISGTVREAVARAWGDEDTDQKPTMTRVLEGTFTTLAEQRLTLVEAEHLYRRDDAYGVRALLRQRVVDRVARSFLERLDNLAGSLNALDQETIAAVNRLSKFVRSPAIRAALGQTETQIDFRVALDEGHIILVNLSGGTAVYEEDADLVGRLLVRSLFFHAKRRAHPERPFFLYLDECHRYLSGDVPSLLAESRKYGLGAILAHQYLRQLGEPEELMRHAVLNNTNLKAVFRSQNPAEAAELAEAVVQIDYEKPVAASVKPTVIGHKLATLRSTNVAEQEATTHAVGQSRGETSGESHTISTSQSVGESISRSRSVSVGESTSRGRSLSEGRSTSHSAGSSLGVSTGLSQSMGHATGVSQGTSMAMGTNSSVGQVTAPMQEEDGFFFLPAPPPEEPWVQSESNSDGTSTSEATSSATSEVDSTSFGLSNSQSSSASVSDSIGTSSATTSNESFGYSNTVSEAAGSSQSSTYSEGESHGSMRVASSSVSSSEAKSRGVSRGSGTSETFESVYADLPGQFHSKENVLSMAADAVRSLPSGRAYVSFVADGVRRRTQLVVPLVRSVVLPPEELAAVRRNLLDASPSALPLSEAMRRVEARENALLTEAKLLRSPPPEPETFRAPRKKKQPPDASG